MQKLLCCDSAYVAGFDTCRYFKPKQPTNPTNVFITGIYSNRTFGINR